MKLGLMTAAFPGLALEPVAEWSAANGYEMLEIACWRARIQFTFPRSVLISPLWHTSRNGCARSHVGKVLVEKR